MSARTPEALPPAETMNATQSGILLTQAATFLEGVTAEVVYYTFSLRPDTQGTPHVELNLATINQELTRGLTVGQDGYSLVETDAGIISYRYKFVSKNIVLQEHGIHRPTAAAAIGGLARLVGETNLPIIRVWGSELDYMNSEKTWLGIEAIGPKEPEQLVELDAYLLKYQAQEMAPGYYELSLDVPDSGGDAQSYRYKVNYDLYPN